VGSSLPTKETATNCRCALFIGFLHWIPSKTSLSNMFDKPTKNGDIRFIIHVAASVGMVYDKEADKYVQTQYITVAYSKKDGYHVWPSDPKGE